LEIWEYCKLANPILAMNKILATFKNFIYLSVLKNGVSAQEI